MVCVNDVVCGPAGAFAKAEEALEHRLQVELVTADAHRELSWIGVRDSCAASPGLSAKRT